MSRCSFIKSFIERKWGQKLDDVVLFQEFGPITQSTMQAAMDPLDVLIQKEKMEEVVPEYVVSDHCIVPISTSAIEATIDPLEILIDREPCLVAS